MDINILAHCFAQVTWEAERGNSYYSDVAIDDLSLLEGPCDFEGSFSFSFSLIWPSRQDLLKLKIP